MNHRQLLSQCGFVLYLSTLTGCAAQVALTVRSNPPGASVYEDGRYLGRTPANFSYAPTDGFKRGSCMPVKPLAVQWISGATANMPASVQLCAAQTYNQEITFERPSLPGRELDVRWAITLENNDAAAERQAQSDAAAMWQTVQQNRAVVCTSKTNGSVVFTNCL